MEILPAGQEPSVRPGGMACHRYAACGQVGEFPGLGVVDLEVGGGFFVWGAQQLRFWNSGVSKFRLPEVLSGILKQL